MLASVGWLVGEYVANKNLLVNGDGRISGTSLALHEEWTHNTLGDLQMHHQASCLYVDNVIQQREGGFELLQVLLSTTSSKSSPKEGSFGSPFCLLLAWPRLGALALAGHRPGATISISS